MKLFILIIAMGCILGALLLFMRHPTSQPNELLQLGEQAYIYAYPLVIMEVTKQMMTHNATATKPPLYTQARSNEFTHISAFPNDKFHDIVRPNVDTLYSFAWLDLSHEPLLLSVPDTHDRYYLMEIMDAWTNVFASLGKRTTGTHARTFALVGPQWKGTFPDDIMIVRSPTAMAWILARTQTNGKKDYDAVRAIQAGYKLTSLHPSSVTSSTIISSKTAIGSQMAPVDYVDAMDAHTFYSLFTQALKNNPPAPEDASFIAQLKTIGIEPGKNCDNQKVIHSLTCAMATAKRKIVDHIKTIKKINGWTLMTNIGTYGTDYLTRAMIAYMGIGANLPIDALYPTAFIDADGNQLNGHNKYVIHFDKDQLPPVNAFWSITMYNAQSFLVKNQLDRYALGDRDHLHYNADGSLDIYIQHTSPGKDKEANWLPAPADNFNLTMRLYWPQKSALNGTWVPPTNQENVD